MKLSDFVQLAGHKFGTTTLAVFNIDDFFREAFTLGIKELLVNRYEMQMIVEVYLANVGNDKNGNQGQILREGVLDKFLGINLTLYAN